MGLPRFFLAHAKSTSDVELECLSGAAQRILAGVSKGNPFSLVLARDYFNSRFKASGSWESWTREVAAGVNYLDRSPIFTAILVPAGPIGAGTAKIVEHALAARKPVFVFTEDGKCQPVRRVETRDREDWQTGYALES